MANGAMPAKRHGTRRRNTGTSQWETALDSERDPEKYRESMIDAGRGHLVKREGYR
jgi:hypothetical protein